MLLVSFRRPLILFLFLLLSSCYDQGDALSKTDQENQILTSSNNLDTSWRDTSKARQKLIGKPIRTTAIKPPPFVLKGVPQSAPAHANIRPASLPEITPVAKTLARAIPGQGLVPPPRSFEVIPRQLAIEQPDITLINLQQERFEFSLELAHFIRSEPHPKLFILCLPNWAIRGSGWRDGPNRIMRMPHWC